jgi:hypothetical protein
LIPLASGVSVGCRWYIWKLSNFGLGVNNDLDFLGVISKVVDGLVLDAMWL